MRNSKNNISFNIKNIILNSKILTAHFTGKRKIITFSLIILILSFINITLSFPNNFVSALSYQTYQRLDFTFNPTIQLTLSSSELTISNLTPDSSSDSNIIDISVATNAFGGLNLISTVGNSSNDTANLVYRNGNTTIGSFDTLSTPAATLDGIGNNQYGYSYSVKGDNDTWGSYSSYASIPKYNDTTSTHATLLSTTGTATSGAVKFKLGARASSSQPSGIYTNVINFSATTKPLTTTYTINYLDSTGEANPASLPAQVTNTIVEDTPVTISSTTPTRSGGYTFKSWCTAPTSNNTCSGNVYNPGDIYNISNIGEPVTINLYAMWQGPLLYDLVASQVKKDANNKPRTQTPVELQAAITTPTSTNPAEDTSNSGVYLYDATTYGVASDASNDYDIYYFRGILDTENGLGTYGSDGQADAYPNYVVLSSASNKSDITTTDTCWRIVRTTGSGGVKMIYNGSYRDKSCANKSNNTMAGASVFNTKNNNSAYIGYTYNGNIIGVNTISDVSVIFGNNTDVALNNLRSTLKQYIEDSWYLSNMMDAGYTNLLEPDAGYCNDRSTYDDYGNIISEVVPEPPNILISFGSRQRNFKNSGKPTLACPRGSVDIYRYENYSNKENSGLENKLKYPVAILTADESVFSGSGRGSSTLSACSTNAYLNSGVTFWLLSPYAAYQNSVASGFAIDGGCISSSWTVTNSYGVRPVVSLVYTATTISGSGTATDPWIIPPPEN